MPRPDEIFPDEVHAQRFEQICAWLKCWFQVLPLDEAGRLLAEGRLPSRACCITFDDGYADNHEVALPILQKQGLCATFFIATGFLNGGRMWNDTVIESIRHCRQQHLDFGNFGSYGLSGPAERRGAIEAIIGKIKYLPVEQRLAITEELLARCGVQLDARLMMAPDGVRLLRDAGMQIGAHTVSHPILASTPPDAAREEILSSKRFLEDLLSQDCTLFAYPNGKPGRDYLPEHVTMVRELGFKTAVSTAWGASGVGADPLQLQRFTPWDRTKTAFGLRLMRNLLA
ncbi:polysaccharide deacetylase family protein [Paucibacter sp. hw1]|uniref:Polysaccharide deacetylase family protein n=1 Tax=Roseateles koreensis TaxID=2987526 RepID=A0ABT5KTA2_9BURK|nr:polysaccharide deacetylase family protein [Roseateles koreensis]